MADDTIGGSTAGASSSGPSSSSLLSLGALGVGAAGLGTILGEGESPLPPEFSQLTTSNVPWLESGASTLFNEGQTFTNQGAAALSMAQNGILTGPQQAQLEQYKEGLTNTADQTYASMGRNINQDTSGISTQADIDAKVNAMSQQQIQTTIALGLGETSAGSSLTGQGLAYESAANNALIAAGQAQLQQDKDYSTALTGAFSSIATILGGAAKLAPALAL
jgi:hypothetical protein